MPQPTTSRVIKATNRRLDKLDRSLKLLAYNLECFARPTTKR